MLHFLLCRWHLSARIPGPSGHIALFTLTHHYSFKRGLDTFAWIECWGFFFSPPLALSFFFFFFCKVASENCEYFSRQTRWVREALSLSKMGINTENYMRVMGGRSAPFGPPFVCALLRSQPGSNWNVILFCYISEFLRKLIILGLCFPPFPVLFASLYEHTKVLKVKVREAQLARLQWEDLLTQHIYEDV